MHNIRLLPLLGAIALFSTTTGCHPKADAQDKGCVVLDPTNKASLPAGSGSDPYPQQLDIVDDPNQSTDNGAALVWGDGEGYIHAPIMAVWTALQNPANLTDTSAVKLVSSKTIDITGAVFAMEPTFQIKSALDMQDYSVVWQECLISGTTSDPKELIVRGDLSAPVVDGIVGTIMTIVSDSIEISYVDDDTTSWAHIRHLQVLQQTDPKTFLNEAYNAVVKSTGASN